jgi:hypothetical protein
MVAGEEGGNVEPEGGVMLSWTELFTGAAFLSLPVAMIGLELGARLVHRRRRRLGTWELLGAEVERLNAGRKTHQ